MNVKNNKIFLYTGLGILLTAFILKWSAAITYWFWILLGVAIVFKVAFLISVFRTKGFKPKLWLFLILTGVAVILISILFKTVFHIPNVYKILFYIAIALKTTGLILMIFSNRKK
jgi:hypothetical protein